MCGSSKNGFSIIELLIVLFIIGLTLSVGLPIIKGVLTTQQTKQFVAELNGLMRFAWQQSIITQQAHRILFDVEKKTIQLEQIERSTDIKNPFTYKKVANSYINTQLTWPDSFTITKFIVNGTDYFNRPGIKTESMWFYISSEGLAQEVHITFNDSAHTAEKQPITLVLNPFSVQFNLYEETEKKT